MKTLTLWIFLVSLALVGCSSIDLPKKSAQGDETFRFYNPDVDNLPEFADRSVEAMRTIQDELRKRLVADGLTEVTDGQEADLVVAYLVVLQNNTVTTAIRDYYLNSGMEIIEVAHEYTQDHKPNRKFKAGTIVVDVYDVSKKKLIYRDYATREILANQTTEQQEAAVRSATDEAIAKFVK